MKTSNLLILALVPIITACGFKSSETISTRVVTKIDTVDVGIAVSCKLPPIPCNFSGDGIIPTLKLMECVSTQKKLLELCSGTVPKSEEEVESQQAGDELLF